MIVYSDCHNYRVWKKNKEYSSIIIIIIIIINESIIKRD